MTNRETDRGSGQSLRSLSIRRSVRRDTLALVGPPAYFLILTILTVGHLLGPGYILTLDAVASPNLEYVSYLFGTKDPMYYGRLPAAVLFDAITTVLPGWVCQSVLLVGVIAGSGLSTYRALQGRVGWQAAVFAGTIYAFNPFVYVRLVAGHWWFLLGYAVLPLALAAFAATLQERGRPRRAAGWTAVACAFDPHVAVLVAIAVACIGGVSIARGPHRQAIIGRGSRVGVLTVGLSAYWLLPSLTALLAGESKVHAVSSLDLLAFGARGTVEGNVPLSVAMLYGFWRSGTTLPLEWQPRWLSLALFSVLLILAIAGWQTARSDPFVTGIGVAGIVGFVFALGVSVETTAGVARTIYEHVVIMRGMRDATKFVALLCLAYSVLGAYGVETLHRWLTATWSGDSGHRMAGSRPRSGETAWNVVVVVVLVAVVLTPLVYAWPMSAGLGGQVSTTEYPESWHAANDHMTDEPGQGRVLVLPWHQYLDYHWTDGSVVNPADAFFERPVIRGRSIDFAGIETQSASPTHERVEAILNDPDESRSIGDALAQVGVEYVVVFAVADYERYDHLQSRPEFTVVMEEDDLILIGNRAYTTAPSSDKWPRVSPLIPKRSLVGGIVISSVVSLFLFRRVHQRIRTALTRWRSSAATKR